MSDFSDDWDEIVGNFAEHFGEAVTLQRGSRTTASVTGRRMPGPREIVEVKGRPATKERCQWLIAKAAYVISSAAVTPLSGDRIIESDGTTWELARTETLAEFGTAPGGNEWVLQTKKVNS